MLSAFLIGGLLCSWVLLRILGNERDQQVRAMAARISQEAERSAAAEASPPAGPQS